MSGSGPLEKPASVTGSKGDPVLVVDDEEVVRVSLRDLLESEGYPVLTASSGEEALQVVENQPVQMVITDIQMPGISGLQLQKKLKDLIPYTPVLIMTAFPTVERAIAALQAGAVNFITKPFDIGTVLDTVERTVSIQELSKHNLVPLAYASSTHTFEVPGTLDHIQGIIHYFCHRTLMVDLYLPSVMFQIRLALDELLVNAVKHGTCNNPRKHVRIEAKVHPEHFEAIIEDEGDGFDLAGVPDPKAEINLYELAESGRGVFLVRCYMDEVEYSNRGRRVRILKHNRDSDEAEA